VIDLKMQGENMKLLCKNVIDAIREWNATETRSVYRICSFCM